MVHVSNQVDNLSLIVDAFFRRDGLLLFPPPMEVGDDEDAAGADAHCRQCHRADEDDVKVDLSVGRVRHGACKQKERTNGARNKYPEKQLDEKQKSNISVPEQCWPVQGLLRLTHSLPW